MSADPPPGPPLRDPRPLPVHFAIDAAVCFLCVIVVGLILGIGWIWLLVASLVIGAAIAPLTHRAEERALAERAARRRALDSGS